MKLIRFGELNKEKAGVLIDGKAYDVSAIGEDYNEQFFETGGVSRLQAFVESNKGNLPAIAEGTRLGSPIARPSKLVCIGLNYANHAKETGAALPPEPVVFMKSTTALCGPFDNIMIPRNSVKTDWEVELAVVIGKKASYVEEAEALDYVAGYALHNDVSEREFQLERNGTWDKGKGCDTFAPIGPWLVTKDEVADVDNLRLWLTVNDKKMQDGNTSDFIFKIPFLVSYVSQFMTLLPGDVISTGTPAGVGLGMNPQVYLKAGDVVTLGIDGLGEATQHVIAWKK
ncbi:2-keto-4-pentenoate hydratase/2-oxohepta-3-ene-1,7-dioic acid hydratase (catechol pathway) [Filimonas lacunae]|uniref:2-keto-4-pentenoate hydratase/2-oxohepta-3-ene-1,7-dioic acid hydratase (Catechol pathway) n=1 Tax=Filimonas lacunae TaxID=477680 RepID=A0A173MAG6_9BACT|nr:fumarylacetoacetate hydrolase family protein [Filimonas lacunae]BAV04510.1 fumarylacetoacetate hydrolase family protein [Filimonas lacunae]SIT31632.1 2-keto-4-pentenoate hydratase/2-oxohepta-3-ene-1,7-dioic acid hydratase (catechol pathway) [Filimonas lacunae]